MDEIDDDCLDHPDDILDGLEPLTPLEGELFVLFAEALDPDNPKTVDEVLSEWREIF
jgi:hypothetical protein